MKKLFLALILISPSLLQSGVAQVPTQEQCQQADAQLNQVYQQLRGSLNDAQKQQLKLAQRDWIKKRDAFVAGNPGNPQGALYQATMQRVRELAGFKDSASQAPKEKSSSVTTPQQKNQQTVTQEQCQRADTQLNRLGDNPTGNGKNNLNNTLHDEDINLVKTIVQTQPDRIQFATLNSGKNIIGFISNNKIFIYEVYSGRLIKIIEFNSKKSIICRIYPGINSDEFYLVESFQENPEKENVLKLNWASNKIDPLEINITGKIIGSNPQARIVTVIEKNNIIDIDSATGVCISKAELPGFPEIITVIYNNKNKKTIVGMDAGEGLSIGYVAVVSEGQLLEYYPSMVETGTIDNKGMEAILSAFGLPHHLLGKPADSQRYSVTGEHLTVNFGKNSFSIEESLGNTSNYYSIINKRPNIEYLLWNNEYIRIGKIQPSSLLDVDGLATSSSASRVVVWTIGARNNTFREDGCINPEINIPNESAERSQISVYDSKNVTYKKLNHKGNTVWNASISDDGDFIALATSNLEENKTPSNIFYSQNRKYPPIPFLPCWASLIDINNNKELLTWGYTNIFPFWWCESWEIYPPLAIEQSSLQFEDNRYKYEPSKWVVNKNHASFSTSTNTTENVPLYRGYDLISNISKNSMTDAESGIKYSWEEMKKTISSVYPLDHDRLLIGSLGTAKVLNTKNGLVLSDWHDDNNENEKYIQKITSKGLSYSYLAKKAFLLGGNGEVFKLSVNDIITKDATFYFQNNSGPIITLDDNHYLSFPGSHQAVHFSNGRRTFPLEQFDLRLNRPDIVLDRLGAPQEAIEAAKSLREKRLKRMGVTEEMLKPDFHLPELQIVGDVPSTTANDKLDLEIKAVDEKYPLDRLRVYVNNVPVNGRDGELLRDQKTQSLEKTFPIKLASGRNKIQVSVLNSAGAESLYANAEVNCTAERPKPKLYAVALGVSQYDRPEWCLKYAAKDATDLVGKIKAKAGSSYCEVKPMLLTDKEVTKESASKIKDFLSGATIDDTVLIFMAGHGLLDDKYDYYFGTTDIDPAKPSERGMPYEAIDTILADVPSLKKALLMDTCHAGELDDDEKKELAASDGSTTPAAIPAAATTSSPLAGKVAMRAIGTRGMQVKAVEGAKGKSDWYEKLQDMFVDLRRGSGATVISSSQGAEYAFESSEQSNGLFTYALMEALDGKATPNKDGQITISTVGDYVKKRVQDLTKGKQNPNLRGVNLEEDFTLSSTK